MKNINIIQSNVDKGAKVVFRIQIYFLTYLSCAYILSDLAYRHDMTVCLLAVYICDMNCSNYFVRIIKRRVRR